MVKDFKWKLLAVAALISSYCASTFTQAPVLLAAPESPNEDYKREALSEMILLSVDKATMKAELKTWPEDASQSKVLKSFKIAMGKEKGDKEKEGDNKTPEGIYFPQKHISGSSLQQSKYGPRAIPLDFPNPIDKLDGKTGYGIWLHGAGNDERIAKTNVTEGCVAFYNNDINRLSSWLEPYQALVVIAKDSSEVNKELEIKAVKERTLNWIAAWQARDLDSYISFYSDDFQLKGRTKSSYADYKRGVFKSYKTMRVGISDLRIVTHPKYAVSIMNQDFDGDGRFISNGRKILFWSRAGNGEWQIVREHFSPRRFTPPVFTVKDINKLQRETTELSSPERVETHQISAKS
ncbi:MAG: L,D-transpeptidase family protein [Bdellovibrionota bacterium]